MFGATLVVLGRLWRIDRFGLLYEEHRRLGAVHWTESRQVFLIKFATASGVTPWETSSSLRNHR